MGQVSSVPLLLSHCWNPHHRQHHLLPHYRDKSVLPLEKHDACKFKVNNHLFVLKIPVRHFYLCFSSTSDGIRNQFRIVLKLFIIMGIPWICDFLSTWLEFNLGGFENSFAIRLCLDIINLTTGVLIFVVLVGLRPVVKGIQERSSGLRTKLSYTKSTSITTESVKRPHQSTRSV